MIKQKEDILQEVTEKIKNSLVTQQQMMEETIEQTMDKFYKKVKDNAYSLLMPVWVRTSRKLSKGGDDYKEKENGKY